MSWDNQRKRCFGCWGWSIINFKSFHVVYGFLHEWSGLWGPLEECQLFKGCWGLGWKNANYLRVLGPLSCPAVLMFFMLKTTIEVNYWSAFTRMYPELIFYVWPPVHIYKDGWIFRSYEIAMFSATSLCIY